VLKNKVEKIGDVNFIAETLPVADAEMLRDAAFRIKNEVENLFLVLGTSENKKALLVVMISDNLVKEKGTQRLRYHQENLSGNPGRRWRSALLCYRRREKSRRHPCRYGKGQGDYQGSYITVRNFLPILNICNLLLFNILYYFLKKFEPVLF
jgi:hypothetical protein